MHAHIIQRVTHAWMCVIRCQAGNSWGNYEKRLQIRLNQSICLLCQTSNMLGHADLQSAALARFLPPWAVFQKRSFERDTQQQQQPATLTHTGGEGWRAHPLPGCGAETSLFTQRWSSPVTAMLSSHLEEPPMCVSTRKQAYVCKSVIWSDDNLHVVALSFFPNIRKKGK